MPTRPTDLLLLFDGYEAKFMSRVNLIDSLIIVRIIKKGMVSGDPFLVPLNDERGRLPEGSLQINTVDNDDDTYTPIKAKLATIKFFASNNTALSSFMGGESDEWVVTIYTDTVDSSHVIFQGFLVLDVATEPYETKPYEVTLTATDNIGVLKNIPLTDFDGNNPKNENKIIKYIAWALSKTNMNLPIYVSNNLMEEGSPGVPFYESCYLHAKTFEKELTSTGAVSEDCYTVLTRIFGNDSRIEQINGAWWIERIYEKRNVANYVHQFDYDGAYVGVSSPTFYLQSIDQRGDIDFINDNAQVTIQTPYKLVELRYNFEYPKEIIDNIDFSRGDLNFILAIPPFVVDGETLYQSKYNIADWTALETPTGVIGGTSSPSTTNNYIRRLYYDITKTFEAQRYVVIEKHSPAKGFYIQSNKFSVLKKDKFDISVDVRWSNDSAFSSSGAFRISAMQVRLHGLSGTNYILHGGTSVDPTPKWAVGGSSFSHVENFYVEGNTSEDMTQWRTCSFITNNTNAHPCPPIPESGQIEILLLHTSFSDQTDINFTNLRFEYIPYLNGGYGKFSGQTNTVSQTGNYSNALHDQIYISNSPNFLIKGSLLKKVGSVYDLAGNFYDGQAFPSGIPSSEFLHPFGYQLAYSLWQQYRTFKRSIDSDFYGLKSFAVATIPDLHKQFFFTDNNPNVNNKYFILLHYEQDFDSQIWKAFFREVYDTTVGNVFTDPYEFKYITE